MKLGEELYGTAYAEIDDVDVLVMSRRMLARHLHHEEYNPKFVTLHLNAINYRILELLDEDGNILHPVHHMTMFI